MVVIPAKCSQIVDLFSENELNLGAPCFEICAFELVWDKSLLSFQRIPRFLLGVWSLPFWDSDFNVIRSLDRWHARLLRSSTRAHQNLLWSSMALNTATPSASMHFYIEKVTVFLVTDDHYMYVLQTSFTISVLIWDTEGPLLTPHPLWAAPWPAVGRVFRCSLTRGGTTAPWDIFEVGEGLGN